MTTIEVPDWAKIGRIILIRDKNCIRGNNPDRWYREKILPYGLDGIFRQGHNCPVYYSKFDEFGVNIKLLEDK